MRNIIDRIGYGHKNAVPRSSDRIRDRRERKEIETANRNGDCIINVGSGYYRPVPGDVIDEKELGEYLAKELSRARKIQQKRLSMKLTFERWKEIGIHTNHTGTAG